MAKFKKGDILYFRQTGMRFYHTMQYEEDSIDKCVVLYSDDLNYYFDSSLTNKYIYNPSETGQEIVSIPIDEIDNNLREYTIGLKTLLRKI